MSALHSRRASWCMLFLFLTASAVLFLTAAGRDLGLVPEALLPDRKPPGIQEIRQAIIRGERRVVEIERETLRTVGVAMEHLGKKLEDHAGDRPAVDAAVPEIIEMPGPDVPGKLLSHQFSLSDRGFSAVFRTDRPVPEPDVFFLSSPALWVVDIPGIWGNAAPRVNEIEQGPIRRVVIGIHEDFLRLVFHYRDRGRARPSQQPKVVTESDGISVVVPIPE